MKFNSIKLFIQAFSVLLIAPGFALAQSYSVVNMLPSSPNSASLGKFSGAKTSLATGTLNLPVSLINYTSKNIKFPISITYTTNGFKVDEIASRVGNQWLLNAGGVITRTVFGSVDERSARIRPAAPLGQATHSQVLSFCTQLGNPNPLQGVGPQGAVDGQPDIFSYNFEGHNGKFILDTVRVNGNILLQPVLLSNSGLKIEKTSVSQEFKITTAEGLQYFFGGNATESTTTYTGSVSGDCGSNYSDDVATSWYLERIVHPNGDVVNFYYSPINFDYIVGMNESMYAFVGTNSGVPCGVLGTPVGKPNFDNSSCQNWLQTKGVILDSITSTYGNKIQFNYIARTDYNDKLLGSINVYAPDHVSLFKVFNFGYQYGGARPFLTNVSEYNGSAVLLKKHQFNYNDILYIPERLSYSQDYWGFFNGKVNTTLIPKPRDPGFAQALPNATANREPDPIYASKGLLNSVIYPTGGKDSIVYEANQSYRPVTIYPNDTSVIARQPNYSSQMVTVYSTIFTVSYSQQAKISGICTSNVSTPNSLDYNNYQVIDVNTNGVAFSKTIFYHQSATDLFTLNPGTYKISVTTYGTNVKGSADLNYKSGNLVTTTMNTNVGGVRVLKILSYDRINNAPNIKKYFYTKLTDPTISSGTSISEPAYETTFVAYKTCGFCSSTDYVQFPFYVSRSNAVLSLNQFPTPTSYADVVESLGENFENGGTEHSFILSPDRGTGVFLGELIYGAPYSNWSYKNGLETYTNVFKLVNSTRVSVKKTYTHYKEDPNFGYRYTGYVAFQRYNAGSPCRTGEPYSWEMDAYSLNYYTIFKAWLYADTVRTLNYDQNGINYTTNLTISQYDNIGNASPTLIKSIVNVGDTVKIGYNYPSDFATVAPYSTMITQHILSPVIIASQYRNSVPYQLVRTNYADWGNNIFAPQSVEIKYGNSAYQPRLTYYQYDNIGNVLSMAKEKGAKTSYVWGYKGLYPIAKIDNAEYSTVITALGGTSAVLNFRNIVNPNDSQVNTFLSPLRTSTTLQGARITTQTYNLINGLTSLKDTKGLTTYYEYDSFQRLMNEKDNNGNISKSYDYHYRP